MVEIIRSDKGAVLTKKAGPIFLSGGFGSEVNRIIAEQGVSVDSLQKGSSFRAPLQARPVVEEVHRAYALSGADILTADSFCASISRANGDRSLAEEHAQSAGEIGRRVSRTTMHRPLVAMSLTASGDCYTPDDTPDDFTLYREHRQNIEILKPHGDLIIAETLPTVREAKIIAKIANEAQTPFLVAFVVNDEGKVLDGASMEEVVETVLAPNPFALGVGVNCCSLEGARLAVSGLAHIFNEGPQFNGRHIVAYPNAFKLSREDNAEQDAIAEAGGCAHEDHNTALTADEGQALISDLVSRGATAVGLCCGSTPAHTQAYVEGTQEHSAPEQYQKLEHG